jgi:hypothetical protein
MCQAGVGPRRARLAAEAQVAAEPLRDERQPVLRLEILARPVERLVQPVDALVEKGVGH